jgi:hypothetical protein
MLVSRCGLFNLLWRHEQQLSHFRRLRCSTAAREWVGGLNSASKVSTLCDPAPNHRLGKLFPYLARNRIEVHILSMALSSCSGFIVAAAGHPRGQTAWMIRSQSSWLSFSYLSTNTLSTRRRLGQPGILQLHRYAIIMAVVGRRPYSMKLWQRGHRKSVFTGVVINSSNRVQTSLLIRRSSSLNWCISFFGKSWLLALVVFKTLGLAPRVRALATQLSGQAAGH